MHINFHPPLHLPVDGDGLGLHARHPAQHQHGPVQHAEGAFYLWIVCVCVCVRVCACVCIMLGGCYGCVGWID